MSASGRDNATLSSSEPKPAAGSAEVPLQVPVVRRKQQLPPVKHSSISQEFLVNLTSSLCNENTRETAHHRRCKDCGFRRPDAVWHHPLGRKKYKYLLEQPASLTGAGRDISFICDAVVNQRKITPLPPVTDDSQNLSVSENAISEEYQIVKKEGIQFLQLYEDAFTVQLYNEEQRLQAFPSMRPTGRSEAMKLMRMMDNMLEKARVDWQSEDLTDLSHLEGMLQLEKEEQSIYNKVFHELIRQVTVGCAERGQLLAKIRQKYQSLLDRIQRRLQSLNAKARAQQSLNHRLTEEINHIKTSMQQIRMEMSKIRDFVSQQAENAHHEMAEAVRLTHINVIQRYHELCELHRARLEAHLLQMTEDRDPWNQLSLSPALKKGEEASAEPTQDDVIEINDEPEAKPNETKHVKMKRVVVQQEEPTVCESPVVDLISSDGKITQKKLEESTVHLTGIEEMVISPLTEESQRAFSDLTTIGMLQRELHDSEVRVKNAEQRALEAEEALQAALDKIEDLERELQGQPRVEPRNNEEKKTIEPVSSPTSRLSSPSKEPTSKPTSCKKRTKKK